LKSIDKLLYETSDNGLMNLFLFFPEHDHDECFNEKTLLEKITELKLMPLLSISKKIREREYYGATRADGLFVA
jgi:hypothetical protein